jgi:hypothetical protein
LHSRHTDIIDITENEAEKIRTSKIAAVQCTILLPVHGGIPTLEMSPAWVKLQGHVGKLVSEKAAL